MNIQPPGRPRRSDRSRQLYEARSLPDDDRMPSRPDNYGIVDAAADNAYIPNEPLSVPAYQYTANETAELPVYQYTPNEDEDLPFHQYEPNEVDEPDAGYTADAFGYDGVEITADEQLPAAPETAPYQPYKRASGYAALAAEQDEEAVPAVLPKRDDLSANLSAYYRRPAQDSAALSDADQHAYAPPVKLSYFDADADPWTGDGEQQPDEQAQMNVYRPREVSWDQTERRNVLEMKQQQGYQVEDDQDAPRRRRKRKHLVRRIVILVSVLAVLGGAAYLFKDKLLELIKQPQTTEALYAAISTPAPARGYDAAAAAAISSHAGDAIREISGTVEMDPAVVTENGVLTRSQRSDGNWDFYLFSATDGKLLAYFEGLEADGMLPMPGGGFYLRQPPYLVSDAGSALIRTKDIEATLGESTRLHAMVNGWSIISNASGTLNNYINSSGQLLSRLWFAKAYPMTGSTSVAYVDTGNVMDTEERYALYRVDAEGNAVKWKNVPDMSGVIASACGMAYMNSGELFLLDAPDAPLLTTSDVTVYLDCDAMVVKDEASGKYGLFVGGEQHYDFIFDSIEPVQSDIVWNRQAYRGDNGGATLCTVTGASYPQPRSHYFLLSKEGSEEYVALSTSSACPVVLD